MLKKLLKSSAFLAILTGGGFGMLTPSLAGAGERKYISAAARTCNYATCDNTYACGAKAGDYTDTIYYPCRINTHNSTEANTVRRFI